jgi:modulator of FtsH protease
LDNISIASWSNYLSVMAGCAATLTGLVFVAVSINLSRILTVTGLTGRAAESMMQLFGVVVISTTVLIPEQTPVAVGTEILVLGSALWLVQTVLQVRYARSKTGHPRRWAATRMVQTQFANIPFCISGILLLSGSPDGLYWLAPGFSFSLVGGVLNAWVLLVEILR